KEIQAYIALLVHHGVDGNTAVKRLERIPMFGQYATQALSDAITATVYDVMDEAVSGLNSVDFDSLVQHITDSVIQQLLDASEGAESEITDALIEVLDLVKEQVAVQQWRSHFE